MLSFVDSESDDEDESSFWPVRLSRFATIFTRASPLARSSFSRARALSDFKASISLEENRPMPPLPRGSRSPRVLFPFRLLLDIGRAYERSRCAPTGKCERLCTTQCHDDFPRGTVWTPCASCTPSRRMVLFLRAIPRRFAACARALRTHQEGAARCNTE